MVHVIEKNTPSHAEKMRKIESHILNAEMLITGQLARSPNYRQRDVMHAAAIDLDQASVVPRAVLNGKCVAPCTLTRTIDSPENEEEGEEGRRRRRLFGMKTRVPRGLPLESKTGLLIERNSYLLP